MPSLSLTLQPVRRRVSPSLSELSRIFPIINWRFGTPLRSWPPSLLKLPSPAAFPEPKPVSSLLATLLDIWFPSIVLAVPKKKVSHSRKGMRSANKGLKDKTNIVACPACGQPKLAHHLCHSCYSQMSRGKSDLGYEEVQDVEKPPREELALGSGETEKAEEPGRDTAESPEQQNPPKSMPTWERREKGLFSGVLSPLTKWFRK